VWCENHEFRTISEFTPSAVSIGMEERRPGLSLNLGIGFAFTLHRPSEYQGPADWERI
jgi:hypothetical protein